MHFAKEKKANANTRQLKMQPHPELYCERNSLKQEMDRKNEFQIKAAGKKHESWLRTNQKDEACAH